MAVKNNTRRVLQKFNNFAKKAGINQNGIDALRSRGYFTAPASKGHHLAYPGGLLEHSVNVTEKLVELTKTLKIKWERPEGPYLVGLLHDLVKCDCYKVIVDGTGPHAPLGEGEEKFIIERGNKWGDLHGAASIAIGSELSLYLKDDEFDAIYFHMGMFGVGKEYLDGLYRDALNSHGPQVLATHFADWWSSQIIERV